MSTKRQRSKSGGGAPRGGGAPAAAVAITGGGGSQVSTDQCNASLLSDVQACVSKILEHEAFAGVELQAPSSMGTGFANREPFDETKCAQAFSADTKTSLLHQLLALGRGPVEHTRRPNFKVLH